MRGGNSMQSRRLNVLRQHVKSRPDGESVFGFINASNLQVDVIHEIKRGLAHDYHAFLYLSEGIKQLLGIQADEILLTRLHNQQQQQWFFGEINQCLQNERRLSRFVTIVISDDDRIERLCRNFQLDPTSD